MNGSVVLRVPPRLVKFIEESDEHGQWQKHANHYLPDVGLFKALAKGRVRADGSRLIYLAKGFTDSLAWWADALRNADVPENDRRANVRTGTSVLRQIEQKLAAS